MVGLHLCYVSQDFNKELAILKPYIEKCNPIAIGEIGIDLYWEKSTFEVQKKYLLSKLIGLKSSISL